MWQAPHIVVIAGWVGKVLFPSHKPVPQMVTHSLSGDYNDIDVVAAPKLMEVVLAHCPGAVDRWVGPYVSLAWSRLQTATRRPLQDQLIALIAVAMHYNVALTLQALEARGATQQLLQGWAEMLAKRRPSGRKPAHFRQQRLKKLISLGLVALLAAPDAALPPAVGAALPAVLRGAVTLLSDLKAQQDEAAANMAAGSGSVDEEVTGASCWGPWLTIASACTAVQACTAVFSVCMISTTHSDSDALQPCHVLLPSG